MNKFDPTSIKLVKQLLDETDSNIVITTHYNPDGDALGSSLALYHYLRMLGKQVTMIVPNDFPDFLQWMPGQEDAIIYFHHAHKANQILADARLIFCLDYNEISRVNLFKDQLLAASGKKILIDHHLEPKTEQFDLLFSVKETSSTAELIFDFINALGDGDLVDKSIGVCLYVGIMTDTGSFSFACNRPSTYHVVATLVDAGVDCELVHRLVYDTYSEDRMRLLGFCLSERMEVIHEYHTAFIWLSISDLEKFNFSPGDTEGVVNYALSIKNIAFAALFTEKKDKIRISFRSKGNFSVNDFARNHYEGGGHRNASGGDAKLPLNLTLDKFRGFLPQYKEALRMAAEQTGKL